MAILHAHFVATADSLAENLVNFPLPTDPSPDVEYTFGGQIEEMDRLLIGGTRYPDGLKIVQTYTDFETLVGFIGFMGGEGLAVEANAITAGTVQAIESGDLASLYDHYGTYYRKYQVLGIEVDAAALYNANLTASTEDDLAFVPLFFAGDDELWLSGAADDLSGYAGNDTVYGFDGNDTLRGGEGDDRLEGGDDNDELWGGAGKDVTAGGAGADLVVVQAAAGASSDSGRIRRAGANNDGGQDTLVGFDLAQDTVLVSATGVNRFVHGTDTTVGAGTGAESIGSRSSFATNTGLIELDQATDNNWADSGDVVLSFQGSLGTWSEAAFEARLQYELTGTSAADTLIGGQHADVLAGGAGNDLLGGGDGADLFTGGAGADTSNVGQGADVVVVRAVVGTSSDSAALSVTGANNDRGQDVLRGFSLVEDRLLIVATNVGQFVHGTDTTLGAGAGSETTGSRASFTLLTGLIELNQGTNNGWNDAGDVAVTFVAPASTLTEAAFEARILYDLTGRSTANVLTGGMLADTINGMGGNDVITGGLGRDRLTGGTGNDIFDFNSTLESGVTVGGRDTITDFVRGQDRVDLRTIDADTTLAGDQSFNGRLIAYDVAFTRPGEMRKVLDILYCNTDADAQAEFSIELIGVTAMGSTDFLL